jgi:hypothetical protein
MNDEVSEKTATTPNKGCLTLVVIVGIIIAVIFFWNSNDCEIAMKIETNNFEEISLYDETEECYIASEQKGILIETFSANGEEEVTESKMEEETLEDTRVYIKSIDENIINLEYITVFHDWEMQRAGLEEISFTIENKYVEGTYENFIAGDTIQIEMTKDGEESLKKFLKEKFEAMIPSSSVEEVLYAAGNDYHFISKSHRREGSNGSSFSIKLTAPQEYCE